MNGIRTLALVILCGCFLSLSWGQNQTDITGKGTTNFIPKFTSRTSIGNSRIFQSPSTTPVPEGWFNLVGIGTANPQGTLDINVGPRANALSLGDPNIQSLLIRDTAEGLIDIQTGPNESI